MFCVQDMCLLNHRERRDVNSAMQDDPVQSAVGSLTIAAHQHAHHGDIITNDMILKGIKALISFW